MKYLLFFSTHLILAGVLNNLCTQVATFDGPQVLLVALAIAGVFVQHVRSSCLCLRLNNGVPQLLSLYDTLGFPLLLVPAMQAVAQIITFGIIISNYNLRD